ncbi:DUF3311 domain-containing protein [Phycisphaeraceae bacterium D3-23]
MGRYTIWIAALLLFVLHQDFWNWGNRSLVFGFMPVGLAYHAGYSVAAALLWAAAVRFAWPSDVEAWAEDAPADTDDGGEHTA